MMAAHVRTPHIPHYELPLTKNQEHFQRRGESHTSSLFHYHFNGLFVAQQHVKHITADKPYDNSTGYSGNANGTLYE